MRIPSNDDSKKILELNEMHSSISRKLIDVIDGLYEHIGVMLPDLTIDKQLTFKAEAFKRFLDDLAKSIDWSTDGVSITTDDLKRMHVRFDTRVKRYKLSCYLAVQYHTLLFYECDASVIKLKEEFDKISIELDVIEEIIKKEENAIVEKEMKGLGYDKLDDYELLLLLYNNQDIADRLEEASYEIKKRYPYDKLMRRREELITALNSHTIDVYKLDKRLIDYTQLMQGEEGLCIYFDLSIKSIDRIDIKPIMDKMDEINRAISS